MTLDLTPRPAAAPLGRMVARHAAMELRLLLRNGEQLLLNLVIPVLLLVMGAEARRIVDLGAGRPIDVITPGVLTLAVLSASFTSLAIGTGFDRRYGVLKRLGATPLPRVGLMVGKLGAVLVVEALQLSILCAVALALGWQPSGGLAAIGWGIALVVVATAAFASLALLMAGTIRAEATLALANLVYVVLLVGGAVVVPLTRYPDAMHAVLNLLPSTALSEGLRAVCNGDAPNLLSFVVLAAWAAVGTVLTVRTFKWE